MESTALTRQHQGNSDSDCRESPKVKVKKEEKKKKTTVKATSDAAEEAAQDDSGATGAAAESAVVRGGNLRDLEVLTIGSDPIDKTSEAAEN